MSNGWLIAQRLLEDDPPVSPPGADAHSPDDLDPADRFDPEAFMQSTFASVQIPGEPDSDYFFRLNQRLGGGTKTKVANNTYLVKHPDGSVAVKYHNTEIIVVQPNGDVTVSTSGRGVQKYIDRDYRWGGYGNVQSWTTVSTMERMNEFLPHGWRLYGKHQQGGGHTDWDWFWIGDRDLMGEWGAENIRVPYTDGDRILANGTLIPQAPPVREKMRRQRV